MLVMIFLLHQQKVVFGSMSMLGVVNNNRHILLSVYRESYFLVLMRYVYFTDIYLIFLY